jgi:AraC-like DNA-binding protein
VEVSLPFLSIVEMIHYTDKLAKVNCSNFISEKVGYNYDYLYTGFSEVKGIIIKQFVITHKIERVKELLISDELSPIEISFKHHLSDVAHLSNQFKNITGLTPSFYK